MEEKYTPEDILAIEETPEQEPSMAEESVIEKESAPQPQKKSRFWAIVAAVIVLVMGLTVLFTLIGNRVDYNDYVTLGQYKGLVVPKKEVTVTDDEVQKQIDANLEAALTYVAVDRAAELDDTVNIDYVGRFADNGTEFSGGSDTKYDLLLGSGKFIDGFEEGLVGKKAGDVVELPLTFPENYQSEALAGVDVIFTVTVNAVKEPVKAVLNDEFVQANSDVNTVEEYRQLIHDQLLTEKQETADSDRLMTIWQTALDNCEILGYPQAELEAEEQKYRSYYEEYAAYYSMTFETFLSANGMTQEQFDELIASWAKSDMESMMVATLIAEAEGITVSQEEYQTKVDDFLSNSGFVNVEAYESHYNESFEEVNGKTIRNELLLNKVVEFLAANSLTE